MHVVPLVLKQTVSIVVIGTTGLELIALRTLLEAFNYRVEIHWVGSRAEAVELLRGSIPTFPLLLLSCHGDDEAGGSILVPDEPALTAADVAACVHLPGKTVLNLGCSTGSDALAVAFLGGGCAAYIAAADDVDGNAALFFALHLFYFLSLSHPNRWPRRSNWRASSTPSAPCSACSHPLEIRLYPR